jgi:hypothetical protein
MPSWVHVLRSMTLSDTCLTIQAIAPRGTGYCQRTRHYQIQDEGLVEWLRQIELEE